VGAIVVIPVKLIRRSIFLSDPSVTWDSSLSHTHVLVSSRIMNSDSLFEKHPGSKIFFGFPKDMDASCDALRKSQRFARHASFMIEMLDKSLNLLGPDAELLADIMAELGQKHVAMGITDPSYYTAMGESLLLMMQEQIGEEFTPEVEHSWTEVYGELAGAMTREIGNSATK